jgi:RNA polymerase sigma-70 factor (ECF subfamily)
MKPNAHSTKCEEAAGNALAAAAAGGDTASFEVLVRRYKRIVLAVGRRMTGSIDDAEDIAQQTFMRAFAKLSMFRGDCSFSTWLVSIAMNEARMWKRKQARCREMPVFHIFADDESAPAFEVPDLRPDPESLYSARERDALLSANLNQLRPATRAALKLCDLQEESTRRTAFLLGITVSAVKSRRSRGRAELRAKLGCHMSSAQRHQKSEGSQAFAS